MIKCIKGSVTVTGSMPTLMAEFTDIIKAMREAFADAPMGADHAIEECFRVSKMTMEEVRQESKKMMANIAEMLKKGLCDPEEESDRDPKEDKALEDLLRMADDIIKEMKPNE